jgi:hypothetical protein
MTASFRERLEKINTTISLNQHEDQCLNMPAANSDTRLEQEPTDRRTKTLSQGWQGQWYQGWPSQWNQGNAWTEKGSTKE